ncbi:MAG: VWA domain-containing protein [Acidobacteria bacterium]|nr:VWA domain-containing protein [Acidobacteriota bacterium]
MRSLISSRPLAVVIARAAVLSSLALLAGLNVAPAELTAQAAPVSMYVSVLDKGGTPVSGLAASEFVVRENGIRREVLRVVQPATDPIDIALVVDNTLASAPHIQDLRAGVTAFVAALHEKNLIALVTFGDRPTIAVDFTHDLAKLTGGIGHLFALPESGSYLLDALVDVSAGFVKRTPERGAIVVVSFEGPELGNLRYQRVLEAIGESGAALSALVVNPQKADIRDDAVMSRHMVFDRGPALSGGVRHDLLTSMGLADSMKLIARQLMNQYRVVYSRPESLIPPDTFEVSVTRPGLEAHGTPPRRRSG